MARDRYVVYDEQRVIWGIGKTKREAMSDARENLGCDRMEEDKAERALSHMVVAECCRALADRVWIFGGNIPEDWEIVDGRAVAFPIRRS